MIEKRGRGRPGICDSIGAEITRSNKLYADKTTAFLARLRYDLRRRAAGLCAYPACPEKAKSFCDAHRLERNRKALVAKERRKNKVI